MLPAAPVTVTCTGLRFAIGSTLRLPLRGRPNGWDRGDGRMPEFAGEASTYVEAPPERCYALVTDIGRMGEWSPETVRAQWLDGATAPAVGARFRGTNKEGVIRW